MFKVAWDRETGGVKLSSLVGKDTISISPRLVFYEELNLLGLNTLGWKYPECEEPLLWACNKEFYYRGDLVFEAKNANIYDKATVVFQPGKEKLKLKSVELEKDVVVSKIEIATKNGAIEGKTQMSETAFYSLDSIIVVVTGIWQVKFGENTKKIEKRQTEISQ